VVNVAETIYLKLQRKSVEVIIDDRKERAGVNSTNADLVGYPIRVNIGKRILKW